jgi:ankyrin repeat protein
MKKSTVILQALVCLLLFSAKEVTAQGISPARKSSGATRQERIFLAAVEAGKIEAVKTFLESRAGAGITDVCRNIALHSAVRSNHTEIVNLLLQAGADAKSDDILREAFDDIHHNEDEEVKSKKDNSLLVKLLIDAGANVNLRNDFDEESLIALAANSNQIQSLELLLKAGAEVNSQDIHGKTALTYASDRGHSEAKALLKSFGANATKTVEWYKAEYGDNAFIQATADGRADVVDEMIENGFQVNTQNAAGVTALMRVKNIGSLQILLNAGANVHLRDNAGFTALIHASADWLPEMVKSLIQAGADIEAKTPDGKTALMFAALQGRVSAVQALLDAGAKVNERDNNNKTALSHAIVRNKLDVAKLLRQAGGIP